MEKTFTFQSVSILALKVIGVGLGLIAIAKVAYTIYTIAAQIPNAEHQQY